MDTENARTEVSSEIFAQAGQLSEHLRRSRSYETGGEESQAAHIEKLLGGMTENLVALDEFVKQRLAIVDRRDKLIRELFKANSVAQRTLAPGARILGSQIADWNRSEQASNSGRIPPEQSELARSIIGLMPQQKASMLADATYAHVKDLVHCEQREAISVKGIAHPVSTYRVVDLHENLGAGMQRIRAKLPHFQLDLDMTMMSPDEQREALAVLLDSVERLSNSGPRA